MLQERLGADDAKGSEAVAGADDSTAHSRGTVPHATPNQKLQSLRKELRLWDTPVRSTQKRSAMRDLWNPTAVAFCATEAASATSSDESATNAVAWGRAQNILTSAILAVLGGVSLRQTMSASEILVLRAALTVLNAHVPSMSETWRLATTPVDAAWQAMRDAAPKKFALAKRFDTHAALLIGQNAVAVSNMEKMDREQEGNEPKQPQQPQQQCTTESTVVSNVLQWIIDWQRDLETEVVEENTRIGRYSSGLAALLSRQTRVFRQANVDTATTSATRNYVKTRILNMLDLDSGKVERTPCENTALGAAFSDSRSTRSTAQFSVRAWRVDATHVKIRLVANEDNPAHNGDEGTDADATTIVPPIAVLLQPPTPDALLPLLPEFLQQPLYVESTAWDTRAETRVAIIIAVVVPAALRFWRFLHANMPTALLLDTEATSRTLKQIRSGSPSRGIWSPPWPADAADSAWPPAGSLSGPQTTALLRAAAVSNRWAVAVHVVRPTAAKGTPVPSAERSVIVPLPLPDHEGVEDLVLLLQPRETRPRATHLDQRRSTAWRRADSPPRAADMLLLLPSRRLASAVPAYYRVVEIKESTRPSDDDLADDDDGLHDAHMGRDCSVTLQPPCGAALQRHRWSSIRSLARHLPTESSVHATDLGDLGALAGRTGVAWCLTPQVVARMQSAASATTSTSDGELLLERWRWQFAVQVLGVKHSATSGPEYDPLFAVTVPMSTCVTPFVSPSLHPLRLAMQQRFRDFHSTSSENNASGASPVILERTVVVRCSRTAAPVNQIPLTPIVHSRPSAPRVGVLPPLGGLQAALEAGTGAADAAAGSGRLGESPFLPEARGNGDPPFVPLNAVPLGGRWRARKKVLLPMTGLNRYRAILLSRAADEAPVLVIQLDNWPASQQAQLQIRHLNDNNQKNEKEWVAHHCHSLTSAEAAASRLRTEETAAEAQETKSIASVTEAKAKALLRVDEQAETLRLNGISQRVRDLFDRKRKAREAASKAAGFATAPWDGDQETRIAVVHMATGDWDAWHSNAYIALEVRFVVPIPVTPPPPSAKPAAQPAETVPTPAKQKWVLSASSCLQFDELVRVTVAAATDKAGARVVKYETRFIDGEAVAQSADGGSAVVGLGPGGTQMWQCEQNSQDYSPEIWDKATMDLNKLATKALAGCAQSASGNI
jgi:hypothetical protein